MTLDDIKAEIPDDYWERVNERIIANVNLILLNAYEWNSLDGEIGIHTLKELDEVRQLLQQLEGLTAIWHEHMKSKPNE